eukprot:COSAG05_NODE_43_length_25931_cov_49.314636_23_plen_86_part_00
MDRDKMCLYQSIVSQLEDDGFYGAASAVAQTAMVPSARQEKDALAKLVSAGQRAVQEAGKSLGSLVLPVPPSTAFSLYCRRRDNA